MIATKKYGYKNIEFKFGDIENLPFEDESFDVIISNCVINLAPDKRKVFKESYRVLKKNGRMFVSDIVLLEELTDEQRNNEKLIAGCVGGTGAVPAGYADGGIGGPPGTDRRPDGPRQAARLQHLRAAHGVDQARPAQ